MELILFVNSFVCLHQVNRLGLVFEFFNELNSIFFEIELSGGKREQVIGMNGYLPSESVLVFDFRRAVLIHLLGMKRELLVAS